MKQKGEEIKGVGEGANGRRDEAGMTFRNSFFIALKYERG